MALVAVVLVVAAGLGRGLGGRVRRLAALPVSGWALVVAAAVAQVGGGVASRVTGVGGPYVAGSVTATALVLGFLVVNRRLHGMALVALGLLLNAVVVAANGAMPVAAAAAARAGVATGAIAAGVDPRHTLAGPGTVLASLADRIPLPLPLAPEVLSVGDVLVAAGLGLLVVTAMTSGALLSDGLVPGRVAARGRRQAAG